MPTYIDFIASRLPARPYRGRLAAAFSGFIGGVFGNLLASGSSLAVQALWLIAGQPTDVLSHLGADRRLRKYISETLEQYRARLEQAVEIWESGGTAACIEGQLDAAGYAGASVHSPLDWGRSPLDWPSQIWAFLPREAHLSGEPFHRAGAGVLCGSGAVAGTGTIFKRPRRVGEAGVMVGSHTIGLQAPRDRIAELQHIVRTFKAGHEVARQILIELDGHAAGSGALAGAGNLCGGEVVAIGMGVPET